jgi:hypothetical protein
MKYFGFNFEIMSVPITLEEVQEASTMLEPLAQSVKSDLAKVP